MCPHESQRLPDTKMHFLQGVVCKDVLDNEVMLQNIQSTALRMTCQSFTDSHVSWKRVFYHDTMNAGRAESLAANEFHQNLQQT